MPLFETARDLEHAGAIMSDLLAIPWYRDRINGHQEVMIGYSDSAKDAGRMSADWALYRAQEEVVAACEKSGVRLTLFHGRGGSIGRGGGPTYLAIQSQPPGSIRGTLRATEQGEMMQAKFGLVDIAIRTLEVYTTATLEAARRASAVAEARMARVHGSRSRARARATYRSVVYDEPRFIPYFRDGHARARADAGQHRQPAGAPHAREGRRKPSRDSVAVCVDADAVDAALVARHRRRVVRATTTGCCARCMRSGRSSRRRSISSR